MTLRTRISLTYTTLVVAGVVLASWLATWQLQDFLDQRAARQLQQQVEALAVVVRSGSAPLDSTGRGEAVLGGLASSLGLRVTVIRRDGVVIYDSEVARDTLNRVENHGNRPEIMKARRGGAVGTDRRHSVTKDIDFLYAAKELYGCPDARLDSGFVRAALRVEDVTAIDTRVQWIVWGVGFVALVLTGIVSVNVSRRITHPLKEIVATALKIKDGDLTQRVPAGAPGEIGQLARSINEMASKLGSDITQLRKLERVRSEFLGNVSHELRTPIFSIQGFLETLLDGAVDDPAVNRDFLEKAHRQAIRLNTLLNDLIEISRIESGDMKMSFRYFDPGELLDNAVEEMREQAERKKITLRAVHGTVVSSRVYGDRERLKQVLINLIDNAVKYTDAGGVVTCAAREAEGKVELSVEDTGNGIAPEHLSRIFERFYRVDRDRSREVGGTGLGLAIVKHIVEAHGSTVTVRSTPGTGSTFSFLLKT